MRSVNRDGMCVRVWLMRPVHSPCTVRAPQFNTSKNRILKSVNWTKNWDKRILKFDYNRISKSVSQIRQAEFWCLTGF